VLLLLVQVLPLEAVAAQRAVIQYPLLAGRAVRPLVLEVVAVVRRVLRRVLAVRAVRRTALAVALAGQSLARVPEVPAELVPALLAWQPQVLLLVVVVVVAARLAALIS
jgi:hypothetical protein